MVPCITIIDPTTRDDPTTERARAIATPRAARGRTAGPRPGGKSGDFRKGGKPGGFCKDSKPGGYRKDDRGPRDGSRATSAKGASPAGSPKTGSRVASADDRGPATGSPAATARTASPVDSADDRGPRDEQRSGADRKDFRARDGKPTGGSAPAPISARAQTTALGAIPARRATRARCSSTASSWRPPTKTSRQDRGPRFDGLATAAAEARRAATRCAGRRPTRPRRPASLPLAAIHQLRERDAFAQDIIAKTIDISPLSREDRAFRHPARAGRGQHARHPGGHHHGLHGLARRCGPGSARRAVPVGLRDRLLQKSPHAAVDQGVELVKSVAPRAGGLANVVLRRVARAKEAFPGDLRTDIAAHARLHGFPVWLAKRLIAELGPEGAWRLHGSLERAGSGLHRRQRAEGRHRRGGRLVPAAAHAEPEAMELGGCAVPGCCQSGVGRAPARWPCAA